MASKKITNQHAKNIIRGEKIYILKNGMEVSHYCTNYFYNSGTYGWNYSIGYCSELDAWIVDGYRIPKTVLSVAAEIIPLNREM